MKKLSTVHLILSLLFVRLKPYVCRLESEHYDNLKIICLITIPNKTSLKSTVERLWWGDFCDGQKLHLADLESGYRIGFVSYFGAE